MSPKARHVAIRPALIAGRCFTVNLFTGLLNCRVISKVANCMALADYLVVGSGLTGATIARSLSDSRREVMMIERRPFIGGNVHDSVHPSGIRIHTYGPHYFRTGSAQIWGYAKRFSNFYDYKAELLTLVDGQHEHWPILQNCVERLAGQNWTPAFSGTPHNFEEASLAMMPQIVYQKFVKGYTEKQWGVPARTLSPELAKRFDVRSDHDTYLSRHRYQGIPSAGYSAWMQRMLEGIPTILNTDYLKSPESYHHRRAIIFTGPIDELFSYRLGRLKYRGQRRNHQFLPQIDRYQPGVQVNNPGPTGSHVRTIEWKHLLEPKQAKDICGTVVTTETPYTATDPDNYEYPFPDSANQYLYRRYADLARSVPGLVVCGRLGEYRYYDMDQAIGRAMVIAKHLLSARKANIVDLAPLLRRGASEKVAGSRSPV